MWTLIITLIIVGLLLLGVEMLVVPGFGVVGILGIASFIFSCYLTFSEFGVACGAVVLIFNIVVIALFITLILRSKTWKKISLDTNINSKVADNIENKGIEIGMTGLAVTRLAPSGNAVVGDVTLEVFAQGALIDAGTKIKVIEIEDNKVFVISCL